MSEERKVICRCGREMQVVRVFGEQFISSFYNTSGGRKQLFRYECECGWQSPVRCSAGAAYVAAAKLPPNPALVREAVENLGDYEPVWILLEDGTVLVREAKCARNIFDLWGAMHKPIFFAHMPSDETLEEFKGKRDEYEP